MTWLPIQPENADYKANTWLVAHILYEEVETGLVFHDLALFIIIDLPALQVVKDLKRVRCFSIGTAVSQHVCASVSFKLK